MMGRAQALEALAGNHKVLQRAYLAEHRRAEDLQCRVDSMEQTIRTQVPRIQALFARLIAQRDQDQLCIAEYRDALAVQRDFSREVEESRARIRYFRSQYETALTDFTVEIEGLEAQLAAAQGALDPTSEVTKLRAQLASLDSQKTRLAKENRLLLRRLAVTRGPASRKATPSASTSPKADEATQTAPVPTNTIGAQGASTQGNPPQVSTTGAQGAPAQKRQSRAGTTGSQGAPAP